MGTSYDEGHCSWIDFEPEPDTTGDGSGDPDKYILTIRDQRGEELATIVHRLCGGKFPLDGRLANGKRHNAQVIVDALNDNQHGETHAERLWQTPAEDRGGGLNTVRLTVVLTGELSPAEMHMAAIDALIAPEVPVNVSEDEGIEIL